MDCIVFDDYFLPGMKIKRTEEKIFKNENLYLTLNMPILTPGLISDMIVNLKKNREEYLSKQPIMKIIDVLDKAAQLWLNPNYHLRKLALQIIPEITGFSKEMVEESINVEQRSSRKEDIIKVLESEIFNPFYLDNFQKSRYLKGYSKVLGPELIVAVFSGNIPALPHLSIMRSLMVKSACLGKVALSEPVYAVLYAKSIEEIDPDMAKSIAVFYWKGGNKEVENLIFSKSDIVINYGTEKSCESIRQSVPSGVKLISHGHKLGFGVVGKNSLKREKVKNLAKNVAYDVAMFDQQACLAPHIYFIEEGGEISPIKFSEVLAEALEEIGERIPKGKLSLEETSKINQIRGVYELKEYSGKEVKLFSSLNNTNWTVIYERTNKFIPSCLNRLIRIVPLEDIFGVINIVKPVSRYLQNVAVTIDKDREEKLFNELCKLGVSRITYPGNMSTPSMMWHHDGMACIGDLVRWCDVESASVLKIC